MNLLLTLSVGNRPWFNTTKKSMIEYSQKINCDFMIIDKPHLNPRNLKCEIYDLLDRYDRIIYLDDTCIITQSCPNLFDIVPENNFGVFCEPRSLISVYQILDEGFKYYKINKCNDNLFFNSGVMVISKIHKEIFKPVEMKNICGFYDQVYFNCKRCELNIPIYNLTNRFNYMIPFKNNVKLVNNVYIYHITRGQECRSTVIQMLNKLLNY